MSRQGGRGESGTRGQRSSIDECKVQREALPRGTINWIQKKKEKNQMSHTKQYLRWSLKPHKLS